jgi:hypothetical protein
MCFSAEMSFGASAVILVIGVISNYKARTFPQHIFALIPLFFSIQQFVEGLLWLALAIPEYDSWRPLLTNFYLSFAWIIWPAFIPFAMGLLEANPFRRKIFHWFTAVGLFVSASFIYILLFHHARAFINEYHIDYTFDYIPSHPLIFTILYLISSVISLLLSSTRKMWIFGFVNLASYLFTKIFFHGHVVSIWCFFGAISSFIVLWIILELNDQKEKEKYSLSEQP